MFEHVLNTLFSPSEISLTKAPNQNVNGNMPASSSNPPPPSQEIRLESNCENPISVPNCHKQQRSQIRITTSNHMNYECLNEENEYVFVELDHQEMDYEILDEDSFDLCNDEELSLSQSPSASASVCSEAMFEELNANPLMLSTASTNIADPEPETREKPLERRDSIASLHEEPTKESSQEQKDPIDVDDQNSSYPSSSAGSRISNKKRRKQIKRQKRAAAAAAAAEALIAQHSNSPNVPSALVKNKKGKNLRSTTTPNPKAPVAVLCAHQSLAEYRNEMKERNGVVGAV